MDKDVYINNGILLSHKTNEVTPLQQHDCTQIILSQKQKDKYHMTSLGCGI